MKISVRTGKPLDHNTDLIAAFVFAPAMSKKKGLIAPLDAIDRALRGALGEALKQEEFTGKRDQILSFSTLGRMKARKLILIGLGDIESLGDAELRSVSAKLARCANSERGKSLGIALPEGLASRMRVISEGLELGAYRFSKYFTGERKPKAHLATVTLTTPEKVATSVKRDIDVGQSVACAVMFARDLSNEPPNVLYPETFAQIAVDMAKAKGLKSVVFDMKEIKKRGMLLLHAVGQGSVHEPRFVHLSYVPAKPKKRLVFVGKGVTFDTGGISIKPAAGMQEMKHDMSGAANVVALMQAVAEMKPDVEVHGIVALAENMPDGNAYRPGDVWTSYEGKTVEIVNTDAEGRLILADAMTYAHRLSPDVMVDNATLTGACVVALGMTCSGYYANTEEGAAIFGSAAKRAGEQMWRMPLLDELKDQLKSEIADLKHAGDRYGGSITAALFLREFIGATKHWIHADIAGPAMADRTFRWDPKGGTGHGVMTFVAMVENANEAAVAVAKS
jgi:leucyl aminopeptidase